jgi:hypothetical protein
MLKRSEAEALLIAKLDRLTRSVVDLGSLVERYFAPGKAALLSVSEQIDTRSAAGRLVLDVLASQWEREAIGERTATAMQHKAAQGEYTGGPPPYGRRPSRADGAIAIRCGTTPNGISGMARPSSHPFDVLVARFAKLVTDRISPLLAAPSRAHDGNGSRGPSKLRGRKRDMRCR